MMLADWNTTGDAAPERELTARLRANSNARLVLACVTISAWALLALLAVR